MLVQLPETPSELLLQALRVGIQQDFNADKGYFSYEGPLKYVNEEDLPFMPVNDSDSVWITVNLWCSYYGCGYERGDIKFLVECAEWLEQRLPSCKVYYGHDVNDENVRLFDSATRAKFIAYYQQVGSEPYYCKDEQRREQLMALWQE
jgi:hypothetical protein